MQAVGGEGEHDEPAKSGVRIAARRALGRGKYGLIATGYSDGMIVHGRLLLDPARPPVPGWLRVEGGRIAEVREGSPPSASMPPSLGGSDRVISPAFYDAHCHFPQIDSVGCDGLILLDWLERVIFPAETWWPARPIRFADASDFIRGQT